MDDALRIASGGVLLLSLLIAAEWLVAYHRLTRGAWRRSSMGRHLMTFMAVIAAVAFAFAARVVWVNMLGNDDNVWFRAARLLVLMAVPVVLMWRRILLHQAQRERRS